MWGENPARVTHLPRGSPRRAGTARRAQAPVSPHSSGAGCRTPSPWGDLAQGPAPEANCCVLSVCASIHTPLETGVVVWVSGWPGCLATTPPPPTWPNFPESWWEPVTRLESQDRGAGRALGLSTS